MSANALALVELLLILALLVGFFAWQFHSLRRDSANDRQGAERDDRS